MLRWLGARIRPLMPEEFHLEARPARSRSPADYWGLKAEEFIALSFVSLTAGTLVGSLYGVLLKKARSTPSSEPRSGSRCPTSK